MQAVIKSIEETGQTTADGMQPLCKFQLARKNKEFKEILTCNQMLDWCNCDMDKDDCHKLDGILNHKKSSDKVKFPSGWAMLVDWNNGSAHGQTRTSSLQMTRACWHSTHANTTSRTSRIPSGHV